MYFIQLSSISLPLVFVANEKSQMQISPTDKQFSPSDCLRLKDITSMKFIGRMLGIIHVTHLEHQQHCSHLPHPSWGWFMSPSLVFKCLLLDTADAKMTCKIPVFCRFVETICTGSNWIACTFSMFVNSGLSVSVVICCVGGTASVRQWLLYYV